MLKAITGAILIIVSVIGFVKFTNPYYKDISSLKAEIASYNEALSNANAIADQRDVLIEKRNKISQEDLLKLQKLLPDNIDNIRLILEIQKMAKPYGMAISNIKYDATDNVSGQGQISISGTPQNQPNNGYGVLKLEFSTSGTYGNFLGLLNEFERNLRIMDISSISLSPGDGGVSVSQKTGNTTVPNNINSYKYSFKIKTYWLKN